MGGHLFAELSKRRDANARRELDLYAARLPEYRALRGETRARAVEYSVWLWQRTVELAPVDGVLTADDLAFIASIGELRAHSGMSHATHQRVLALHTSLVLREIHEATGPDDGGELRRLMEWFGPQTTAGSLAYSRGYAEGLRQRLSHVARVAAVARALLDGRTPGMVPELMRGVGMRLHGRYAVTVVRLSPDAAPGRAARDGIVERLVARHEVPMVWEEPGELVALVPDGGVRRDDDRALSLARDFAAAVGRPCAIGTSPGGADGLKDAYARARAVARAAPLQAVPRRLHVLTDVFVELGVARMPEVDEWLRDLTTRLSRGPDLIATLDAYYRQDMNRLATAAALGVHPRTLDYQLQRVRELSGMNPGSTQGVRALSAAVTRALSG